jgi:ribosomal protein S18 acetylase RimI-like enzyme
MSMRERAEILIREASSPDDEAIWQLIAPVIRAGETYAVPTGMSRDEALAWWRAGAQEIHVAETWPQILGTYYLGSNEAAGPGVATCGFVASPAARGRGIGRAMAAHSLERARALGFKAMQFDFVVATNQSAVHLWQSFNFEIASRLPRAFDHPRSGLVDVYVMHRRLR